MRRILVIGIGTGDPDHITLAGIKALQRARVVFVLDKGEHKAALVDLRRAICARHLAAGSYHWVELEQGARAASLAYTSAVQHWHAERAALYERAFLGELGDDDTGAILVWGDPALYDSTLRVLEQVRERVAFEYEVVPGISSPQLLAARHKISLNQIAGAVHVTTGRRLTSEGWPPHGDDVVVMLDGECAFRQLDDPELEIYWGAYLGSEHELLCSGRLAERKEEIVQLRASARARHGWIMDTYLLRRRRAR
jgi:precorrin-6A synthase